MGSCSASWGLVYNKLSYFMSLSFGMNGILLYASFLFDVYYMDSEKIFQDLSIYCGSIFTLFTTFCNEDESSFRSSGGNILLSSKCLFVCVCVYVQVFFLLPFLFPLCLLNPWRTSWPLLTNFVALMLLQVLFLSQGNYLGFTKASWKMNMATCWLQWNPKPATGTFGFSPRIFIRNHFMC